ncbi:hypothetical protein EXIGLDRAFT_776101 [Exidia glandulosa HHB12029]|uniref:Uncharacterized protein n=1 Tax=Exidia glandulosa HHB12029 TaxID=1314781 RepID=A0A165ZQ51_EXIGL|nr:hypothetical protein EXIGLDRAFT_776101 [Exidia glandulosa HHB12029]
MAAGSVPQEIIVPNTDPSISYFPQSADWVILMDGSRYQDGDLWLCGNRTASILFTFSGTYFSYNGGMNVDHGQYSVSLDGKQVASLNGYSPDWLHVQSLYSQSMDPGPHTVQISNLDDTGKIIVLDYFSYRPVVREVQNALDVTVASSDDTIMYQPAAQWEQSGIVAQTTHAGASASFPFTGEHIWYYADMGDDHGAFSITIAGTSANFSAFATSPQPVQLLFDRALDPGQYTITVTNLEEGKVAGLGHFL